MPKLILAVMTMSLSLITATEVNAAERYWLVIGTYRQGPGGRPEVSGITSPSVYAIPMQTLDQCKRAGKKISDQIYKPVWQFDSRWTCVSGGSY
tara:strand:+ start:366 stop:647 length:282 start_codon:yes stop_codon:yes gene_type:complete